MDLRKEELSLFLNGSATGSPTVWTLSPEPIIGPPIGHPQRLF
jgi:hypothetical protein